MIPTHLSEKYCSSECEKQQWSEHHSFLSSNSSIQLERYLELKKELQTLKGFETFIFLIAKLLTQFIRAKNHQLLPWNETLFHDFIFSLDYEDNLVHSLEGLQQLDIKMQQEKEWKLFKEMYSPLENLIPSCNSSIYFFFRLKVLILKKNTFLHV